LGAPGIVVIPGVELSTIVGEADVHILGTSSTTGQPPAGISRAFQERTTETGGENRRKLNRMHLR